MRFLIATFTLLFALLPHQNNAGEWGKNGHRTVGEVATQYLNDDAQKAVDRILGGESMAIASTWMD